MIKKIGRNDPCHCGSNKKYKKCCLENDKKNERQHFVDDRYQKIKEEEELTDSQLATRKALDWVLEKHEDVAANAVARLIGDSDIEDVQKGFLGEEGGGLLSQLFNEYTLIDYGEEYSDPTLLSFYLHENKEVLNEKETESLIIKLNTRKTLYEAQKIIKGRKIMLKDYFSGEKFWVEENGGTESIKKWDIIFARVETCKDGTKKTTGPIVEFPREAGFLDNLKKQYNQIQKLFANNEKARLFNLRRLITPLIFQNIVQHYSSFANKMIAGLINKDGDKLMFCHKTAVVCNYEELDLHLENNGLLTLTYEDEKEKVYCWLDENNSIIASFYLKKKKLAIETNSKKRMEKIEEKFIIDLKKWTKNWETDFEDPENLFSKNIGLDEELTTETKFLGGSDEPLSKKEKDELVAKQIRKHYDDWIDMELPALDGMTPRQASRDKESKDKLIELLKTMENRDARGNNIIAGFDIERIKRKLGIKMD